MAALFEEFNKAKNLLTENFIDNSSLDVKLIMLSSLGIKEEELILNFNKDFKKSAFNDFWQKIQRRINGEPVSKIINSRFFWNNKFYVNKDVLDPRPDSEIIIEAVLDDYSNEQELNILDLGTGSGCLILTLLSIFKKSRGLATDINEKSLLIAKKNSDSSGIKNILFKLCNWNDNMEEKFDIIVSNPPYIKTKEIKNLQKEVRLFDPIIALDGGNDGLDCYRYIAKNIKKNMKNSSKIYLEIGKGQDYDVENIFKDNNFKMIRKIKDLNGIYRVMVFSC